MTVAVVIPTRVVAGTWDYQPYRGDTFGRRIQYVISVLTQLGYDTQLVYPPSTGSNGSGENPEWWDENSQLGTQYEFAVYPAFGPDNVHSAENFSGTYSLWAQPQNRQIPMFLLCCDYFNDNDRAAAGATGLDGVNRTAPASNKLFMPLENNLPLGAFGRMFPIQAGEVANVTAYAHDYTDSSLLMAWKHIGASGQPAYVDTCAPGNDSSLFPMLLTYAIRDGVINPPKQRIKCFHDMDDTPEVNSTIAEMDRMYAGMQKANMPITFGLKTDPGTWVTYDTDLFPWVAARSKPNGGLIYPIEHADEMRWGGDAAGVVDKSLMATIYPQHITRMTDVGIPARLDSYGYKFFSAHRVSEEALQLLSPEIAYVSSPNNDVKQAGYGVLVTRRNGSSDWPATLDNSGHAVGKFRHRGMVQVGYAPYGRGSDVIENSTDDIEELTVATGKSLMVEAIGYGRAMASHGDQFYDGHDGNGDPDPTMVGAGFRWFESIVDLSVFMSPIMKWVHPSELNTDPSLSEELQVGIIRPIIRSVIP